MRRLYLILLSIHFSFLSGQDREVDLFYTETNLSAPEIVFISGHYPINVYYAQKTREEFKKYTERHGYGFYYEVSEPMETKQHALHFRRCQIIQKAFALYPSAQWLVWVDSDVYVNRPDLRLEDQIDLSDTSILYHLFHEKPWSFPVNTGVKIVNRDAIELEQEVWDLRNTDPWNQFPYEQKTIIEYIIPKIPGRYIIHDPYVLNCILNLYPDKVKDALFVHMCARSTKDRNKIMRFRRNRF